MENNPFQMANFLNEKNLDTVRADVHLSGRLFILSVRFIANLFFFQEKYEGLCLKLILFLTLLIIVTFFYH